MSGIPALGPAGGQEATDAEFARELFAKEPSPFGPGAQAVAEEDDAPYLRNLLQKEVDDANEVREQIHEDQASGYEHIYSGPGWTDQLRKPLAVAKDVAGGILEAPLGLARGISSLGRSSFLEYTPLGLMTKLNDAVLGKDAIPKSGKEGLEMGAQGLQDLLTMGKFLPSDTPSVKAGEKLDNEILTDMGFGDESLKRIPARAVGGLGGFIYGGPAKIVGSISGPVANVLSRAGVRNSLANIGGTAAGFGGEHALTKEGDTAEKLKEVIPGMAAGAFFGILGEAAPRVAMGLLRNAEKIKVMGPRAKARLASGISGAIEGAAMPLADKNFLSTMGGIITTKLSGGELSKDQQAAFVEMFSNGVMFGIMKGVKPSEMAFTRRRGAMEERQALMDEAVRQEFEPQGLGGRAKSLVEQGWKHTAKADKSHTFSSEVDPSVSFKYHVDGVTPTLEVTPQLRARIGLKDTKRTYKGEEAEQVLAAVHANSTMDMIDNRRHLSRFVEESGAPALYLYENPVDGKLSYVRMENGTVYTKRTDKAGPWKKEDVAEWGARMNATPKLLKETQLSERVPEQPETQAVESWANLTEQAFGGQVPTAVFDMVRAVPRLMRDGNLKDPVVNELFAVVKDPTFQERMANIPTAADFVKIANELSLVASGQKTADRAIAELSKVEIGDVPDWGKTPNKKILTKKDYKEAVAKMAADKVERDKLSAEQQADLAAEELIGAKFQAKQKAPTKPRRKTDAEKEEAQEDRVQRDEESAEGREVGEGQLADQARAPKDKPVADNPESGRALVDWPGEIGALGKRTRDLVDRTIGRISDLATNRVRVRPSDTPAEADAKRRLQETRDKIVQHDAEVRLLRHEAARESEEMRRRWPRRELRELASFYRERTGDPRTGLTAKQVEQALPKDLKDFVDKEFSESRQKDFEVMKTHGMLTDESFIKQYLAHQWKSPKKGSPEEGILQQWTTRNLRQTTEHTKQRKYSTIAEGMAAGLTPRTLDIADLALKSSQESRAVAWNRKLINDLKQQAVEDPTILEAREGAGETIDYAKLPKIIETASRVEKLGLEADYVPISRDHYALRKLAFGKKGPGGGVEVRPENWRVHKDAAKPVEKLLDQTQPDFGVGKGLGQAYDVAFGTVKKTMLSLSLFHHVALAESSFGSGAMGLANPAKYWAYAKSAGRMGKEFYENVLEAKSPEAMKNWTLQQTRKLRDSEAFKQSILEGTVIEPPAIDIGRGSLVFKGPRWIADGSSWALGKMGAKGLSGGFKKAAEWAVKAEEAWDSALWDGIYLYNKVKTQQLKKARFERAFERQNGRAPTEAESFRMGQDAANFANNAFGGLNWNLMWGVSGNTRQWLNRAFLAPDWTLSAIRQAGMGLGAAADVALSPLGLKNKLVPEHMQREALKYWGRMVGYTLAFQQFAQWALMSDGESERREGAGLSRWMWDNPVGQKMNFFAGTDERGVNQYGHWGKQYREVPKWGFLDVATMGFDVATPFKQLGNKLNPIVNMVYQQISGYDSGGYPAPWEQQDMAGGEEVWSRLTTVFFGSVTPFAFGKGYSPLTQTQDQLTPYRAAGYLRDGIAALLDKSADPEDIEAGMMAVLGSMETSKVLDPHSVLAGALSAARQKEYKQFFEASQESDIDAMNYHADRLSMLGSFPMAAKTALDRRYKKALNHLENGVEQSAWDQEVRPDMVRMIDLEQGEFIRDLEAGFAPDKSKVYQRHSNAVIREGVKLAFHEGGVQNGYPIPSGEHLQKALDQAIDFGSSRIDDLAPSFFNKVELQQGYLDAFMKLNDAQKQAYLRGAMTKKVREAAKYAQRDLINARLEQRTLIDEAVR